MQLTGDGVSGDPRDPDEAVRVLRRAVDEGVNLIDTADSYGPAVAEELIQNRYNLADRASEALLDHCEAAGIPGSCGDRR
jgi:aryl-alcohol dehydrogenase-like predicted oxidoreductase